MPNLYRAIACSSMPRFANHSLAIVLLVSKVWWLVSICCSDWYTGFLSVVVVALCAAILFATGAWFAGALVSIPRALRISGKLQSRWHLIFPSELMVILRFFLPSAMQTGHWARLLELKSRYFLKSISSSVAVDMAKKGLAEWWWFRISCRVRVVGDGTRCKGQWGLSDRNLAGCGRGGERWACKLPTVGHLFCVLQILREALDISCHISDKSNWLFLW